MTTRTAFVTGASSGIGAAAARRFLDAGWRVVATGRRRGRLEALAGDDQHDRLHVAAFDLRDADALASAVGSLPPGFDGVDLLLNNAGLARGTAPAQQARLSDWEEMLDTNVRALARLTHALLPGLIQRRGAIVNVSSTAARWPYPGGNVYGATKAFVSQFSLGLRADLHGTGVRVTALEPGMAETEFTLVRTHGDQAASDALYRGARPMSAGDIADAILWIANLPPHVNVNRLELMPTSQSFAGFNVARD